MGIHTLVKRSWLAGAPLGACPLGDIAVSLKLCCPPFTNPGNTTLCWLPPILHLSCNFFLFLLCFISLFCVQPWLGGRWLGGSTAGGWVEVQQVVGWKCRCRKRTDFHQISLFLNKYSQGILRLQACHTHVVSSGPELIGTDFRESCVHDWGTQHPCRGGHIVWACL